MRSFAALLVVLGLLSCQSPLTEANNLSGTVTSASGPEAGVWVIAETTDLPTRFAKIVVTDDPGASTIPPPGGAGAACGRPTRRAPCSTARAGKTTARAW